MWVMFADADTARSAGCRERAWDEWAPSIVNPDGNVIAVARRVPTAGPAAQPH